MTTTKTTNRARRAQTKETDGELNPAALAATLREHFPRRRLHLVLGMMAEKEPARVIAPLLELEPAPRIYAVPLPSPRAMPPRELLQGLRSRCAGIEGHAFDQLETGLRQARADLSHTPLGILVVSGSLYHLEPARLALAADSQPCGECGGSGWVPCLCEKAAGSCAFAGCGGHRPCPKCQNGGGE